MSEDFKIENTTTEVRIDTPTTPTEKVVVFLPGISGGAFSDRFQPVVDACLSAGFAIARVNAWKDADDVGQKTLSQIYADIDAVLSLLQEKSYTSFFGVGKSFGGAVMLTHPCPYFAKKVLWAPAIGTVESGANINEYLSTPLGTIPKLLDVKVDRAFVEKMETPTLVVHGTADDAIPFSNSELLVSMLPNAKLFPVEGADHSYKKKEHEEIVIKATMDFLCP